MPLQRKTPLKSSSTVRRSRIGNPVSTPLKTRRPLQRGGQLRPRSAKQESLYRERRPFVAAFLENRPWCEFPLGCTERAVDVHEVRSRGQGGSILDEENCRSSCRVHNGWAEDHPAEAQAIGWKVMDK